MPKVGAADISAGDGAGDGALIEADRLDRERTHLLPIADAEWGLAEIEAGRTCAADAALAQIRQRHTSATTGKSCDPLR